MSTQTRNPSSIYVGAVVAIVALSSVGILLRILAVRRMRAAALARQSALPGPMLYPQRPQSHGMATQGYYNPPRPPANSYTPNRPPNQDTWAMPAPAYSPPYQPPNVPPPASPRFSNIPSAPTPNVVTPTPSSPQPRRARSPPHPVPMPVPIVPGQDSAQPPSSLVERMREVQTLMLEIHQLESQPASQTNRTKIQDLQRRVTELSGMDSQPPAPPIVADVNDSREPPPYNLDGAG